MRAGITTNMDKLTCETLIRIKQSMIELITETRVRSNWEWDERIRELEGDIAMLQCELGANQLVEMGLCSEQSLHSETGTSSESSSTADSSDSLSDSSSASS
jgi:hypothetical protein